jgi:mono/diheme cytochrome c family protein
MADRATVLNPIDSLEQWQVTAYLIAISPELQRSAQQRRLMTQQTEKSKRELEAASQLVASGKEAQDEAAVPYDPAAAKDLLERRCAQCHGLDYLEDSPPASAEEARELVARMVQNGLSASKEELAHIIRYLGDTYAK